MEKDGQTLNGLVKWFDIHRGFGYVIPEGGGGDILIHANVLRSYGLSSLAENSRVRVRVQYSSAGAQASDVLEVRPPEDTHDCGFAVVEGMEPEQIAALPVVPARVKWFDRAKGFGFAVVFATAGDVFLHIEVLRRSALADLAPGEAVGLRVTDGARGRLAVEIVPWGAVS